MKRLKTNIKKVLWEFCQDGKSSEYCANKIQLMVIDELIELLKYLEKEGGNNFVSATDIVDFYIKKQNENLQ